MHRRERDGEASDSLVKRDVGGIDRPDTRADDEIWRHDAKSDPQTARRARRS